MNHKGKFILPPSDFEVHIANLSCLTNRQLLPLLLLAFVLKTITFIVYHLDSQAPPLPLLLFLFLPIFLHLQGKSNSWSVSLSLWSQSLGVLRVEKLSSLVSQPWKHKTTEVGRKRSRRRKSSSLSALRFQSQTFRVKR